MFSLAVGYFLLYKYLLIHNVFNQLIYFLLFIFNIVNVVVTVIRLVNCRQAVCMPTKYYSFIIHFSIRNGFLIFHNIFLDIIIHRICYTAATRHVCVLA